MHQPIFMGYLHMAVLVLLRVVMMSLRAVPMLCVMVWCVVVAGCGKTV